MMADPERPDSYLEIQMDRQTVVLAAIGFLVLLVLAFLVGRWTKGAPGPADEVPERAVEEGAPTGDEEEALADARDADPEDVDSAAEFGSRPVSVRGAKPVAPVPAPPPGLPPPTQAPPPAPGAAKSPGSTAGSVAGTQRAAATQPAPTMPAASASGGYVIQVAAVASDADARAQARSLETKGYPVRVVAEGGYHKVQVGPYAKRSEAQVVQQRLEREEKLTTWLKRP